MRTSGIASLTVIITLLAVTFLFAYLRWWDDIFRAMGRLAVFMNLGFYVFFSTAVLLAWLQHVAQRLTQTSLHTQTRWLRRTFRAGARSRKSTTAPSK